MIALIVVVAYLAATLHTFRYTGGAVREHSLTDRCRWDSICSRCKCAHCGQNPGAHQEYRRISRPCEEGYKPRGPHFSRRMAALLIASAWPAWWTHRGYLHLQARGVTDGFFKQSAEILTASERAARRAKRIDELERELGIGKNEGKS